MYYIQKKDFVGDCLLWWRENNQGYTINLDYAGKYTEAEARSIVSRSDSSAAHSCAKVDNLRSGIMRVAHADFANLGDADFKGEFLKSD